MCIMVIENIIDDPNEQTKRHKLSKTESKRKQRGDLPTQICDTKSRNSIKKRMCQKNKEPFMRRNLIESIL